jgi:hypothetical protein
MVTLASFRMGAFWKTSSSSCAVAQPEKKSIDKKSKEIFISFINVR